MAVGYTNLLAYSRTGRHIVSSVETNNLAIIAVNGVLTCAAGAV